MIADLVELLAAQDVFPKFYFRCKASGDERIAFGSIKTCNFVPAPLEEDPSRCFYGAMPFSKMPSQDPLWKDFSSPFFFLPEWEIHKSSCDTKIITHGKKTKDFTQSSFLPSGSMQLKLENTTPSQENWHSSILQVLEKQKEKTIEKIVLARKATFALDANTNPYLFLKKLIKQSPSANIFALQTGPSSLFMGASPERLYHRKQRHIQTEAIAGTRKRGVNPIEDEVLGNELLTGLKEQKEFTLVCDFLLRTLNTLCDQIEPSLPNSLIKTEKVQHLYRSFSGILKSHISDSNLLNALHPTPAVGGSPTAVALSLLSSLEGWDRGLYAGPIGWISSLESSFTVAIRSALIEKGYLHAFSGAGIVEGSCPHAEWEELNHKISHWQ